MGYARSPFRAFESYLRIVVALDKEDIQLNLKQYNSNCDLFPRIYTVKGVSETVYTMGDHDGTLQIEYDENIMKTKPILTRFGATFGTMQIDERSFSGLYWVLHLIGIINLAMQLMLTTRVYILVKDF